MITLDEELDIRQEELDKSVEAAFLAIVLLLASLTEKNGQLVSDENSQLFLSKLQSELSSKFSDLRKTMRKASNHRAVLRRVKHDNPDIKFDEDDINIIASSSKAATKELTGLLTNTIGIISGTILTAIAANTSKKILVTQIKQHLIGGTGQPGRPLAQYSKTLIETRFMDIFALMVLKKSRQISIERWEYSGNLIKDSRDWCVEHLNQILTYEEILEWESFSWRGKAPGNSFITRGGYNCRHWWTPIKE